MKSSYLLAILLSVLIFPGCGDDSQQNNSIVIGAGQMPNVAKDNKNNLYIVYGSGDSILYSYSTDEGKSFSAPALISILPHLAASHMRGPQIAATSDGLVVTACNKEGDIFSYKKLASGNEIISTKVNDVDTVAKEGLMALAGNGQNTFAVWLDLRDKHNKIFGARSTDGGKTWSKNILVYASPDTTVCECCKPSVAVKGDKVFVMYRNWLRGNRDLYLIESADGGNTFGQAKKLGNDSWTLNGCPMDGGGLVINNNGLVETVWRRKSTIYACLPGQAETPIGEGRNCTIEAINGKSVYAWTEKGEVAILKPENRKILLGKGSLPVIKAINNEKVICVWENEKQIRFQIVSL